MVITGSAGVGKTALALHWAHRVRDRFPDGELYANLRGYDDSPAVAAEVVLDRILRDLGVSPQGIPADLDERAALFRSLVADRRLLIVLDNVADIAQVRPLIPGSPGPFVIITSRNQLAGLAIRDGARRIRLDIFQESDAVALLRQVTKSGGRRDAADDLAQLAQLCARLPLALRLAAEHAVSRPTMRLAELIADLRDDSMLWEALSAGDGSSGDAVRTVFAWSYRDLSADAARMFRSLGLHAGPDISLSAAATTAGLSPRAARRALDILLGAFLIESIRPGRYQLHDLLRAYALDQAREIDTEADRREATDRVLRWYIGRASLASQLLLPGASGRPHVTAEEGVEPAAFSDSAAALDWFSLERPNLVANGRRALDVGHPRRAWELAMALSRIHAHFFVFDDWAVLSALAVTAAEELGDQEALASALDNRGQYLSRRRLLAEAGTVHSQSLSIRQQLGDQRGVLKSLNALGLICLRARELTEASRYFADIVAAAHGAGNLVWEGIGRTNLAQAWLEAGDVAAGLEIVKPLPRYFAELHDPALEGNAYWLLSWAQRMSGNPAAALAAIEPALLIAEGAANRVWEAHWLTEAAQVHLALGDTGEAIGCCRTAASLQRQIGDPSREAAVLDLTGEVLSAAGNVADAAAFHREAARMHQQLGDNWRQALAIIHLADCQAALDLADASRQHLAQALALIESFSDNQAVRVRADLQARLS